MGCRGVHFALNDHQVKQLLSAENDDKVLEVVQEEIEGSWDKEWLQETDKAWDAIHRCLTDGKLNSEPTSPLHKCILGGQQLYEEEDYIVSYLIPEEVGEVAAAIKDIDEEWMRRKYFAIDPNDYGFPLTEEDFEYTWSWFEELRSSFKRLGKTIGL